MYNQINKKEVTMEFLISTAHPYVDGRGKEPHRLIFSESSFDLVYEPKAVLYRKDHTTFKYSDIESIEFGVSGNWSVIELFLKDKNQIHPFSNLSFEANMGLFGGLSEMKKMKAKYGTVNVRPFIFYEESEIIDAALDVFRTKADDFIIKPSTWFVKK